MVESPIAFRLSSLHDDMVGPAVEQPFAATAAELEERRLFSDIIGILRSHSISADAIPTLCLVGVQSHGYGTAPAPSPPPWVLI